MKKLGLFLALVVMSVGAAGCDAAKSLGGGDKENHITVAEIAGTYAFTKLTRVDGVTLTPSEIGGTVTLTSGESSRHGIYSMSLNAPGETRTDSGTFELEGDTIIHWSRPLGGMYNGTISSDLRTITEVTENGTFEFTKV